MGKTCNPDMGEGFKGGGIPLPIGHFSTSKMTQTQNGDVIWQFFSYLTFLKYCNSVASKNCF